MTGSYKDVLTEGLKYVPYSRREEWERTVDWAADHYSPHWFELMDALKIIEYLNNGGSLVGAKVMLDEMVGSDSIPRLRIMDWVARYADRGPELYRYVLPEASQQMSNDMFLMRTARENELEQQLALKIASELHEDWRNTRKLPDGTFEPRWKAIKDEKFIANLDENNLPSNIRKVDGKYEIDIANTSYENLSADWQEENFRAAQVVAGIIIRDQRQGHISTREEIGTEIHYEWLQRNTWAKDDPNLGVPYEKLSVEEQLKDIKQYNIGKQAYNDMMKAQSNQDELAD